MCLHLLARGAGRRAGFCACQRPAACPAWPACSRLPHRVHHLSGSWRQHSPPGPQSAKAAAAALCAPAPAPRAQGSAFFLGGVALVVYGWTLVGFGLETYGFWLLFSAFFPTVLSFLRRMPFLKRVLDLPAFKAVSAPALWVLRSAAAAAAAAPASAAASPGAAHGGLGAFCVGKGEAGREHWTVEPAEEALPPGCCGRSAAAHRDMAAASRAGLACAFSPLLCSPSPPAGHKQDCAGGRAAGLVAAWALQRYHSRPLALPVWYSRTAFFLCLLKKNFFRAV